MQEMLYLQLFADGSGDGGAAAAGTGDGGNTGAQVAEAAAPQYTLRAGKKAQKPDPMANVRYGIQPQDKTNAPDTTTQAAAATEDASDPTYEQLIKGKYKADHDAYVQNLLNGRFKKANELQAQMDKVNSFLPALMQKYGLGEGATLDDLANKVTDDDALYEEEADKLGTTVDVVRNMRKLQARNEMLTQQQQRTAEEMRMQQHFAHLSRQAEALKQIFPGFDLMTEINKSPEFARLTSPEVNIPLETAYRAVHAKEIESGAMQYGAQRAAQQVAAAVKANQARPVENGMGGQPGIVTKTDPSTLKLKDIAEIKRQVAKGVKVSFG